MLDHKYAVECGVTNTGREALSIRGVQLLSMTALARHLRMFEVEAPKPCPAPRLGIRLNFEHATSVYLRTALPEEVLEAVLARVKSVRQDMSPCALTVEKRSRW
ncbi:MAG: hypothetical protein AAGA15_07465 [Pseudomonadota bacterium]